MPWLRLLRLPNLFTAPGDSLAGYFLASAFIGNKTVSLWTIVLLAVTSVFIYAFGVVMNDLVDYKEDCINRPERPLPSGKISRQRATGICIFLWLVASVCCRVLQLHIESYSLFVFVVLFIILVCF